uniref:Uncharacterized protein n=1 Tax=Oryza meridionalis TaxID=40149 RepID=A0A0E0F606_9ORYZ
MEAGFGRHNAYVAWAHMSLTSFSSPSLISYSIPSLMAMVRWARLRSSEVLAGADGLVAPAYPWPSTAASTCHHLLPSSFPFRWQRQPALVHVPRPEPGHAIAHVATPSQSRVLPARALAPGTLLNTAVAERCVDLEEEGWDMGEKRMQPRVATRFSTIIELMA